MHACIFQTSSSKFWLMKQPLRFQCSFKLLANDPLCHAVTSWHNDPALEWGHMTSYYLSLQKKWLLGCYFKEEKTAREAMEGFAGGPAVPCALHCTTWPDLFFHLTLCFFSSAAEPNFTPWVNFRCVLPCVEEICRQIVRISALLICISSPRSLLFKDLQTALTSLYRASERREIPPSGTLRYYQQYNSLTQDLLYNIHNNCSKVTGVTLTLWYDSENEIIKKVSQK